MQPKQLPRESERILRQALEQSKLTPVLFWGQSSVYGGLDEWPTRAVIPVAESIREDANAFFKALLTATRGFYFLEADRLRDELYLVSYDYRNSTSGGIHLFLASQVRNEATFVQAQGRTRRGGDNGSVFALPRKMFLE